MLFFPLRSHRDCKELPRQPLRSRGAPTMSIGVFHCVVSKPNKMVKKAASSLPPPLCVQALSTSSWLLIASKPGYYLPICRSRMMQTLCTSFRDEGLGGPQGVGEFGYANGWTSTGGCSRVTITGLCMSSGMKTLAVTLIS